MCNQDAVAYDAFAGRVVVAVADGHGSADSPYSHLGAQVAVSTVCRLIKDAVSECDRASLNLVHKRALMLPMQIVQAWRQEVAITARQEGLNTGDAHRLWLQFGCTLVAAALHPKWILLLQIGDGDILLVEDGGKVHRFGEISDSIGDATDSLCEPNAESKVRWSLLSVNNPKPLVLLCTDGYSKSFASREDFYTAGRDWMHLVRKFEPEAILEKLDEWLDETSEQGSGDDVTLAVAYWQPDYRPSYLRQLRVFIKRLMRLRANREG